MRPSAGPCWWGTPAQRSPMRSMWRSVPSRRVGDALRPGIEGRAVEAIGRKIVADGNLGQYFLYSGVHSVGVIEFEPPIFGPSSPAPPRRRTW